MDVKEDILLYENSNIEDLELVRGKQKSNGIKK